MVDLTNLAEPTISIFEKIFVPLKQFAEYQLEKVNFHSASSEAFNKLSNLAQVRTINEFDKSVSLYDFYVDPYVTNLDKNEIFLADNLDDFLSPKKILISGIVGQGKSILMRNLAIKESFKSEKFPIFMELRELDGSESLEKFIHKNIGSITGLESHKLHTHLLKEGKVILFFDGFDEVKTAEMGRVIKEFEKLANKFPELKFIVSSRPEETIEKSTIFSKFLINKLDLNGQINIINKLTTENFLKENLTDNLKSSNNDIKNVLVTPLMVNFYFYLYRTEQIKGSDITLFYNQLFDLTLRKHDGTKLVYQRDYVTKLSPKELQGLFECICFLSCNQKTFFFNEYSFRSLVGKSIKILNIDCSVDDLIRDLTTGICFLHREGQSYAFLHTSIPEFFCAKFVIKNIGVEGLMDKIIDGYQDYINVIKYMELIDKKFFLLKFLHPILVNSIDYFKSKEILGNIYISSKYYNKNSSDGNVVNVWIIFDAKVHSYIVFDFKEFIESSIYEGIKNRFKRRKNITYKVSWRPNKQSSGSTDEIEQSENYFLHERLNDISTSSLLSSSKRKDTLTILENEEFKAIASSYSQRYEGIEKGVNLYILRLNKWMDEINKFNKLSIDDLFS